MSTLCAAFQETVAARADALALQDSAGRLRLTWSQVAAKHAASIDELYS